MKRDSDLGSAHRRWSRVSCVCVVVTTVFTVLIGGAGVSDATMDTGLDNRSVSVVSAAGNVTVSWQIRSGGTVRLRLYRLRPDGGAILLTESMAHSGVSLFEVVDRERPPGPTAYQLRVVDRIGHEKNLGSALCVESRLSSSLVTATPGSFYFAACGPEAIWQPQIVSTALSNVSRSFCKSPVPCPDPPVPRATCGRMSLRVM